jgi:hypothetical protein
MVITNQQNEQLVLDCALTWTLAAKSFRPPLRSSAAF